MVTFIDFTRYYVFIHPYQQTKNMHLMMMYGLMVPTSKKATTWSGILGLKVALKKYGDLMQSNSNPNDGLLPKVNYVENHKDNGLLSMLVHVLALVSNDDVPPKCIY